MRDQLVDEYLARLDRAAAGLPPDRRTELLEGIAEHIASAGAIDEADVRTLLDRLGPPEEIAFAAYEDLPAPMGRARGTGLELAAVLMLTVGSVYPPLFGWVVGAVLLWMSPLWRVREKLLGTLVWPGGPGGVLLLGGIVTNGIGFSNEQCTTVGDTTTCSTGEMSAVGGLPLLAAFVPPLVVGALLYRTARGRAGQQPARPVGAPSPWGGTEVAGVLLLGLGGLVLPLVPAVVGLVLLLTSAAWTRREKRIGVLLAGLPVLLAGASLAVSYASGDVLSVGPMEIGLLGGYLGLLLGPVLAAGWFAARLQSPRP